MPKPLPVFPRHACLALAFAGVSACGMGAEQCLADADCGACRVCGNGACVEDASLLNACGECAPARVEICADTLDNDCNGEVDEPACLGCNHTCAEHGLIDCSNGQVRKCETDANGCRAWSPSTPCESWQVCGATTCVTGTPPAVVLLNEVLYDAIGTDTASGNDLFVELWGPAGQSLDGYELLGVNGAGGLDYNAVALDGGSIGADGFFLLAHPSGDPALVASADLTSTQIDFQNGPDAVQVRWHGVLVDALGYGVFAAADVFAGEGVPAAGGAAGNSLTRDAAHSDSGDNSADFSATTTPTPRGNPPVCSGLCQDSDGCCPGGCDAGNDNDCSNCAVGSHDCGGLCVSDCGLSTCGGLCGVPCSAPANSAATCDCTSCGFACNVGFEACETESACRLAAGNGALGPFNTALFDSSGTNDALLPPGITRAGRVFTVDTRVKSVFELTSLTLAAGDTLAGKTSPAFTSAAPALELLVSGAVRIDGVVVLNGTMATEPTGCADVGSIPGEAGPGGYVGGAPSQPGLGAGGGGTGIESGRAGCGAGHAQSGQVSTRLGLNQCAGGSSYVGTGTPLAGGSGGGGGAYGSAGTSCNRPGSGGGGGGAVRIVAREGIVVGATGSISARGGLGALGLGAGSWSYCGGGGSGGTVHLQSALSVQIDGSIDLGAGDWQTVWDTACAPGSAGELLVATPSSSYSGSGSIVPSVARITSTYVCP